MSRLQYALAVVIAGELAIGGALFVRQRGRPAVPVGELSYVDALLAGQLRDMVRKCRSPDDWARLGEAYLSYGYFSESEACYRLASEQAPTRPDLAYEWAFAVERLGHNAEANAGYERAIRLGHPQPDDCWYFIGRNWLRMEKADEARQAFRQAGEQPSARYELARLLVRSGKFQEAIPVLDRLEAQYPKAVQPYLLRYRIEALQGGPLEAVYADRAGRATDVLPSPWNQEFARLEEVHDRMGVAGEWRAGKDLLAQNRYDEAAPRLRKALSLQWEPTGADLLAKVEARHGQVDEALYLLQEVLDRDGPSVHFLTRLADVYEQKGQLDQAAKAWLRATQLGLPAVAKHRDFQDQKLANYYKTKGDTEASRRHQARANYLAGQEAFWDDKLEDARIALEKAVELDPGLAHAWFYLGETRRLLGQSSPARQAYQRCLEVNPDHGRALASLALLDSPTK